MQRAERLEREKQPEKSLEMRKTIIAAVAALAIAPFTASIPVAHADPCVGVPVSQLEYCETHRVLGCDACGVPGIAAAPAPPPEAAPANVPNDSCAAALAPPNPSVGAYNGCETARRAQGGQ
jgi:hypothetical protein